MGGEPRAKGFLQIHKARKALPPLALAICFMLITYLASSVPGLIILVHLET